ncbi:MAG: enoyl-CoA hydratase/isomerase family protein [Rubrivivax sp.]
MATELPTPTQLLVRQEGPVLHVLLNRPAVRNAMSLTLLHELQQVLHHAEADGQTRVVVLRGAGGHFCAGADLKDMAQARSSPVAPDQLATMDDPVAQTNAQFGHLCAAYARTGLATVAVLEGTVMGGGFGLACSVDVALACDDVVFRLPETSLGVLPAQIAPFLMERLGYAQAKRLAVTAARLDAQQALALGLVHEVCTADTLPQRLQAQLTQILQCAPQAIAATKALLAAGRFAPPASLIDAAAQAFARAARGPEAQEGLRAFAEKRPAAWTAAAGTP